MVLLRSAAATKITQLFLFLHIMSISIRGSFPEVIWTIHSGVRGSKQPKMTKIYQKAQFSVLLRSQK